MKSNRVLYFLFSVLEIITAEVLEFTKLVKTATYVDKTLLLEELFKHDFAVVTAPRGSGKSTNVDMIKAFLSIAVDDKGQQIVNVKQDENGNYIEKPEQELTENYRLFKQNNLNVYRNKQFFYQNCANHTVLHVSFKSLAAKKYEEVIEKAKLMLSTVFQEHKYLTHLIEDEEDKARYSNYLEKQNQTVPEIQCGLTFLARLLNQHYRKKPIVLIDDYDSPILESIYNSYKDYTKIIEFIRIIYSHLLIENRNVDRAFITANNEKLAKVLSVYTNNERYNPLFPNEFEYFPFQSEEFSEFYAFTSDEVTKLLKKQKSFDRVNEIETWYGGYQVNGKPTRLFRIVSILKFLEKGFGQYSVKPGIKHLKEIFVNSKIQEKVHEALSGKEITLESVKIDIDYVIALFTIFKKPLGHKLKSSSLNYAGVFLNFLADSGYFSVSEGKLKIPNKEIADDFSKKLHTVTFYVDSYNFDFAQIENFIDSLTQLNISDKESFTALAKSIASMYSEDVTMPNSDFDLYSVLYTFANIFGEYKAVLGRSHAIGPRGLDLLVVRNDGVAIAIQVGGKAELEADGLREMFDKRLVKSIRASYGNVKVRDRVYIGLHLSASRQVVLSYLVNSVDVSRERTVSS